MRGFDARAASGADVQVLIAGAGPVGLALCVELGLRGITCRAVERSNQLGLSPRAKTTNVRTREHLRRWGIADALRDASPIPPDYPPTVVFATRMNGPILSRFENAFNGSRVRNDLYSEEAQWVPQYTLEQVLRTRADTLPGVEISFGTSLDGFEQDADGVTATLTHRGDGRVETVRADYLIGADGARSVVRNGIGVSMLGNPAIAKNYSVIFRSRDLTARTIHGPALMYWLVNGDMPAVVGPMDDRDLFYLMATRVADTLDPETVDPVDLIRRSTGLPDLHVEIMRTDPWTAFSLVADRYAAGRVILAGDACHLHPPFGGFGMNMGVGDAVDLGWKLAACLQGWGGPGLLATYEIERRPVHERTIREASINYATVGNQLVRPRLEEAGAAGDSVRTEVGAIIQATKAREFYTLGLVLGARYEGSAIVVADGSAPPPEDITRYTPSAHPGCLAPHAWLADGSSLYDHFGPGYTMLITGTGCAAAMQEAAASASIPLVVLTPHEAGLEALYGAAFALIRPDQHVAWRGNAIPADPRHLLAQVTGHV